MVRQDDFPALKRLLWCGEKLPTPALVHWMKRLPHVTFDNLDGTDEETIASSYHRVARCPEDLTAEIPIGSPRRGELLLVLDDQLRPVKPGDLGDLYIGGSLPVLDIGGIRKKARKYSAITNSSNLVRSNLQDRLFGTHRPRRHGVPCRPVRFANQEPRLSHRTRRN